MENIINLLEGIGCMVLILAILWGMGNQTINYKQDFHD